MRSSFHALIVLATASVLSGCAIHANERQVGTAAGAVVGGTVGHVLSDGSAIGTVGGAAAGAVLGGEIGRKNERARDGERKPRNKRDDD
ncbi:MAG: glycine zipper 2TM domain-containing protein [Burkholderiaceae bacterium]|jgi:osmotically inducible lipoprotein OsmB|nr:glycine zipper 2TM domain-containing protein [Burkholderiaceae bacterium]